MAPGVGFEPTCSRGAPVFKTGAVSWLGYPGTFWKTPVHLSSTLPKKHQPILLTYIVEACFQEGRRPHREGGGVQEGCEEEAQRIYNPRFMKQLNKAREMIRSEG